MANTFVERDTNKSKIVMLLSILYGLFLGTDIVYIFTIGTTRFLISEVYTVVLFFILIIIGQFDLRQIRKALKPSLILWILMIIASIFGGLITFMRVDIFYRYFVGLIALGISASSYFVMISLFDYRRYILMGITIGLLCNILIGVMQYSTYQAGSEFLVLYNLFPQSDFYLYKYNFGTQGLFLEPSHMIQYIASVFPIWLGIRYDGKIASIGFLWAVLLLCAFSGSGTSIIIYISVIIFFVTKWIGKKIRRTVRVKSIIFWCIIMPAIVITLTIYLPSLPQFQEFKDSIIYYLELAINGSNITDSTNTERYVSITTTIKLIPETIFGCGWNLVHTLLMEKTSLHTPSAFSDLLEMTLEIGILGIISYLYFILKLFIKCIKRNNLEAKGIAISLGSILVMQIMADYAINTTIFMVFGWAVCLTNRKGNAIDEKSRNSDITYIIQK